MWGLLIKKGLGALVGVGVSDRQMDVVDKSIGHIASGLDKLQFTDQEKASYGLEFLKLNNDQNSTRSIIRRAIALLWLRVYLGLILLSIFAYYKDKTELAEFIKGYVDLMSYGTLIVLCFFFGTHMLRSYLGGKKK